MLKYVDTKVTFSEVPDEISLCINFSNCPHRCKGCHSSYLQEDIGEYFELEILDTLIKKNEGITCICLMGGDSEPDSLNKIAKYIKDWYPYKVAWYSGNTTINSKIDLDNFDIIKLGPYMEKYGGLDSPTTNQRMYKIENITHRFQR